jgi:predicted nucleotidyltransferase
MRRKDRDHRSLKGRKMNIHIDKEKFDKIKSNIQAQVLAGSHLYEANNEGSDFDFLCIYLKSASQKSSIFWKNHQLQYKEGNVDYILVDLQLFIRNLIAGDSSINYEVLYKLHNTPLSFLCQFIPDCKNYNILKMYNGFASRDVRNYKKEKSAKKLFHVVRGSLAFDKILSDTYTNVFPKEEHDLLVGIKNSTIENPEEIFQSYSSKIEAQRVFLNDLFQNQKSISRSFSKSRLQELDELIIAYSESVVTTGEFKYTGEELQYLIEEIQYK